VVYRSRTAQPEMPQPYLISLFLLANALLLCISSSATDETSFRHVCIVDSGSTGSRLYIYRYGEGDPYSLEAVTRIRVRPALSSFVDNPDGLAVQMDKLIGYAKEHIPQTSWSTTPFSLSATAGLRKMEIEQRTSLVETTNALLHSKLADSFAFKGAHVISGETEALYGISAVLVAMKAAEEQSDQEQGKGKGKGVVVEQRTRYGVIDLGGSSLQWAFHAATDTDTDTDTEVGRECSVKVDHNLTVADVTVPLYLRSFTGLGLLDSMEGLLEPRSDSSSVSSNSNSSSSSSSDSNSDGDIGTAAYAHPCVPPGGVPTDSGGFVHGAGNFSACVVLLHQELLPQMVRESGMCLEAVESENNVGGNDGVVMDSTTSSSSSGSNTYRGGPPSVVIGLDNAPSLLAMMGLGEGSADHTEEGKHEEGEEETPLHARGLISPAQVAQEGQRICKLSSAELLHQVDPTLPSYRGHRACFGAALLYMTLQEIVLGGCGKDIAADPSDVPTILPLASVPGLGELGWAVGAALHEAISSSSS
jgi:hypothetical protein